MGNFLRISVLSHPHMNPGPTLTQLRVGPIDDWEDRVAATWGHLWYWCKSAHVQKPEMLRSEAVRFIHWQRWSSPPLGETPHFKVNYTARCYVLQCIHCVYMYKYNYVTFPEIFGNLESRVYTHIVGDVPNHLLSLEGLDPHRMYRMITLW